MSRGECSLRNVDFFYKYISDNVLALVSIFSIIGCANSLNIVLSLCDEKM